MYPYLGNNQRGGMCLNFDIVLSVRFNHTYREKENDKHTLQITKKDKL